MTQEKWGKLRQKLLKTVGQNNYTTWIEPLEFDHLQDGVAVFNVPTNFMGNYVSQNFADLILYELNTSGETVQRVKFQVAANKTTRPASAPRRGRSRPRAPSPGAGAGRCSARAARCWSSKRRPVPAPAARRR